jgi:hypothetical protein
MIIDLSPVMLSRVKNYRHKVDRKLLSECAYYPRQGCHHCSWDAPNPDCRWSHILIDTRCGSQPIIQRVRKASSKKGENWMAELISRLPPSAKREVEDIIKRLEVK